MRLRLIMIALGLGVLATHALLEPLASSLQADQRSNNPVVVPTPVPVTPRLVVLDRSWRFRPVFDIMNRLPENKGCVGCHIGPEPAVGIWFGNDLFTVLRTLETGRNPLGDTIKPIPVAGGRDSLLALFLHAGVMPLGGQPWEEIDLALLDWWLMLYE